MNNNAARNTSVNDFFDTLADGWEARNYPPEKLEQVDELIKSLPLAKAADILDVGCGEGVLQPFLRKYAPADTKFMALDPSSAMLQNLSSRFPHVHTLQACAEAIPLPDASVDMVICFSAFPHIADKSLAAKEFFRVLRPQGRAYVLHIDGREKLNLLHDSHHAVKGDHLPCPKGMGIIFSAAGFTPVEAHEGPDHYHFCAVKN
ncbi:MAG: class I SAM-dependent methyltransferase [Deltaproteobacteria bacterium]|nr:class I SAM-dependent methyltransferase [Deltaproteobacteria bacterium]